MLTARNGLDGSAHDGIEFLISVDNSFNGIVENPKRKGQVDCHVFVGSTLLTEQEFDYFNTNSTDDHGGSSGDGRNNFTCDQLDLEVICLFDLVVTGLNKTIFTLKLETPPMNSMWKLVGSSFSNSMVCPFLLWLMLYPSSSLMTFSISFSSSSLIRTGSSYFFFSSISILTPALGTKGWRGIFLAISTTLSAFVSMGILNIVA